MQIINLHNTRLFPKENGASAYRLSGIAARCDWAVMTDSSQRSFSLRGNISCQPRTVFLSLRSFFHAIPCFYEEILPKIHGKFVLITGSEDITIPNQTDKRWRTFSSTEKLLITKILNDDRVIHWFVENKDENREKMSTLPVGYVCTKGYLSTVMTQTPETLIRDRSLKMLCAHRIRDGGQWEVRRKVTKLCSNQLPKISTILTDEISEMGFRHLVRKHPFTLCVQGGGLDPSPKAWLCIINGSIPIIKSSTLDDAYSNLPVAFVDEWNKDCLSKDKLLQWIYELSPYYEDPELRSQTLERLSLDYWWNKIIEKAI